MHKVHEVIEKLEEAIASEFNKGVENVDVEEMGKAIDMLKDLMDASKNYAKKMYYCSIIEAMQDADYGEDYDYAGPARRYYDNYRYANGRFAPKGRGSYTRGRRGYTDMISPYENYDTEWYRDMDRDMGRMYYSGSGGSYGQGRPAGGHYGGGSHSGGNYGGMRDSREGRSGQSRRGYMESKEMHRDTESMKKELEKYMGELSEDMTEMISGSTQEEKALLRQKLSELSQKIV